jgi:hypothetical protein
MNQDRLRQALTVLGFVFAIALNGAANALPLNGQTTGEISDRFQVYVVPAGYVFAIWGLIYLGQLAFVIQTLRPSKLRDPLLRRLSLLPALAALFNGSWIIAWHFEIFPLSLAIMIGLLLTLIAIYRRGEFDWRARFGSRVPFDERWLVQVPFSLYLGWITVATIANVASVGEWANVPTFGIPKEVIAAVVLAVGLLIAAVVMLRTFDATYGAVIIWAYAGVFVKESATPVVAWVTAVSVLLMIVLVVWALLRPPRANPSGLSTA